MRILGLDWGTVRVGAAITDPEGKMAFPLEVAIKRTNAVKEIAEICRKNQVEKIVIGAPVSLNSQDTNSAKNAKKFTELIAKEIQLPTEMLDERFSSVAAQKLLEIQGLSSKEQRGIKDNIAAQIILQAYLDKKN